MVYVELKAMLYAICYLTELLIPASDSKVSSMLPARIFKMPCFGSSALTFQAGESIRKHLRMTKDVPSQQMVLWL